ALPGGDPLAEALAAGETPSPEMVAASGSTEAIRPKIAVALLGMIALQLIALCWVWPKIFLMNQLPLENSPDVLTDRQRARDRAASGLYGTACRFSFRIQARRT